MTDFPIPQPVPQTVRKIDLVGMTFRKPHYPQNFIFLNEVLKNSPFSGGYAEARLEPDFTNEHDPNAVKVIVDLLGPDAGWLGYVPNDGTSAWLAQQLRDGVQFEAKVEVRINPKKPQNPGATLTLTPS